MSEPNLRFDDTYARTFPQLCQTWAANVIERPRSIIVNQPLAQEIGLDPEFLATRAGADFLSGSVLPPGANPVAQAYAGHQFGGYSPRLGDGRALLVGEIIDTRGRRLDLHLKGSGRTPFARGGDGKAAVGPMVREFIIGEAMYGLGIPTTRALGVVATGENITRETLLPGAVLARIASSHIRVGTFQYAASLDEAGLVRRLADYVIERHPSSITSASDESDRYLALLEAVVDRQAKLIAQWVNVGFIHGVMNTDNMTISGETIDFGPCAFMDAYDPATVFSSIDTMGRYAYGNQPQIGQWNLARFAETLLPLIDSDKDRSVEKAMAILERYPEVFRSAWSTGMSAKLGLTTEPTVSAIDTTMFDELLSLMQENRLDYTSFFRFLSRSLRRHEREGAHIDFTSQFAEPSAFISWYGRWIDKLLGQGTDLVTVADRMDAVNPVYIPRNHVVENVLAAAAEDDLTPTMRLVERLRQPFTEVEGFDDLVGPAPAAFAGYRTFCGT